MCLGNSVLGYIIYSVINRRGYKMDLSEKVLKKIRFFGPFGDVAPIFADSDLRASVIEEMANWMSSLKAQGVRIDKIVGLEARGFILGAALAQQTHTPFAWVRSGGKLHEGLNPIRESCVDYSGKEKTLEVSRDHFAEGEQVLVVDDWFETGAQAKTALRLLETCGVNVVGFCTIVDDTSAYKDAQQFFAQRHYFYIVKK